MQGAACTAMRTKILILSSSHPCAISREVGGRLGTSLDFIIIIVNYCARLCMYRVWVHKTKQIKLQKETLTNSTNSFEKHFIT